MAQIAYFQGALYHPVEGQQVDLLRSGLI